MYKCTVCCFFFTSSVAKVVAKVPFTPGHEMVGEVGIVCYYSVQHFVWSV